MMQPENPYETPQVESNFSDSESLQIDEGPTRTLRWLFFSFQGRIPRRIYWAALLSLNVVFCLLVFGFAQVVSEDSPVVPYFLLMIYMAALWMFLAVYAKRLHDRNKSGWWILLVFLPIIGPFWIFLEMGFLPGSCGPNSYGPRPT